MSKHPPIARQRANAAQALRSDSLRKIRFFIKQWVSVRISIHSTKTGDDSRCVFRLQTSNVCRIANRSASPSGSVVVRFINSNGAGGETLKQLRGSRWSLAQFTATVPATALHHLDSAAGTPGAFKAADIRRCLIRRQVYVAAFAARAHFQHGFSFLPAWMP